MLVMLASVFVSGKPFQPSLMFLGKAGASPSKAPITLGYAPGLTHKHQTKLERPAIDKLTVSTRQLRL